VSDPKHKAETEAYLAQCEAEQRAAAAGGLNVESLGAGGIPAAGGGVGPQASPNGSQLLKPKKGFVIKTWKKEAGRKDFDREMGKVFVNVCQHEDIGKPESKQVTADGRRGESWSLPNLCSPAPREEKDKADHVCVVLDIVFHNEVPTAARAASPPPPRASGPPQPPLGAHAPGPRSSPRRCSPAATLRACRASGGSRW